AEVTIHINGRAYDIACDAGQEGRIVDLASYIDQKLQQIARAGAAYNDAHLTVLTALAIADELFDSREASEAPARSAKAQQTPVVADNKENEQAFLKIIEQLTKRIDGIAARVQIAA